jgi:hypothetical protein
MFAYGKLRLAGIRHMDWVGRLRRAFDRVKEFPEFLPDERMHWLELRAAVEKVLERRG